jgi:replicative DNA helicase
MVAATPTPQAARTAAPAVQNAGLKALARERRQPLLFLSQIDRSYEAASRPCPGFRNVRLPNPLDLSAFDTGLFLRRGTVRVQPAPA